MDPNKQYVHAFDRTERKCVDTAVATPMTPPPAQEPEPEPEPTGKTTSVVPTQESDSEPDTPTYDSDGNLPLKGEPTRTPPPIDNHLAERVLKLEETIRLLTTPPQPPMPDLHHKVLPTVIGVLASGDHAWLVGPAGTGKSTIGHDAARALTLQFGAISLSPNTPVSEIVGYRDANGNYQGTVFRTLYEQGGLFLVDEADNGHPSTLAKVNMALSNGMMAFPDGMVTRHPDFKCVVAANTYGQGPDRQYVGRMQLDAATLDRFATVYVGVDEDLEHTVAHANHPTNPSQVDTLLTMVRRLRKRADDLNLPLMFSPRASIFGAKLLAQGFSMEDVIAMRVRKGISDTDWQKVNS